MFASRNDSLRLPEATSRSASVVGSFAPVAEAMTAPLVSVTWARPAAPPSSVDGSWAWKSSSASGGSCPTALPLTVSPTAPVPTALVPGAPPVRLEMKSTLGCCLRSEASTPACSSCPTTT